MTSTGFKLYLPPDASPERRAAHDALRLAVEAEHKLPTPKATAARHEAEAALGRVLLAEDKARRPEFYGLPATPAPASTCRTCKHLDVKPDVRGRLVMRRDSVHPCRAPVPDVKAILPNSVVERYGFSIPDAGFMGPDDGEGCPTYEPRAKT